MSETAKCEICGEPMPAGETMFKFHGYSGPCPKPPLPRDNGEFFVTDPDGQEFRCAVRHRLD